MKIRNTEDVLQYPEAYEFLTEEQQTIIVNYMNAIQDLAQRYYDTHLEYDDDTYKHNMYLKLYIVLERPYAPAPRSEATASFS